MGYVDKGFVYWLLPRAGPWRRLVTAAADSILASLWNKRRLAGTHTLDERHERGSL
jgi:hypothetical protein